MNILVLGSGGREHSLIWAIKQNPKCDHIVAVPGNAGIAEIAQCIEADPTDGNSVLQICSEHAINFVIIGPEAPLVAGVSDRLRENGFLVFGPSKAAAALEGSKSFTKQICEAAAVPTAAAEVFFDKDKARSYIEDHGAPIVVKADGLAAGKGVTVAMDVSAALDAVDDIFNGKFGAAGASVVIEEFMEGEEASLFVLCDGTDALTIGTAQDHKRAFDGEKGPNTGGMGAYSPAPIVSAEIEAQSMAQIIKPTLAEMARRGTPYQGVLYAGLMISDGRPRLVEYNVRFGDPEAQVLMMRLGAQVLDLLLAVAEERLTEMQVHWAEDHALSVVLAANGYPGTYSKGATISGVEAAASDAEVEVFHAGTAQEDGQLVSSGGRVLNVTARASTLLEAKSKAYRSVELLDFPNAMYRKDIGWRAL